MKTQKFFITTFCLLTLLFTPLFIVYSDNETYEPVATASEVFVVYNSSYTTDSNNDTVQDSLEIANYYKNARSIPNANVVGITAPTTEDISRADYNTYIKAGIEDALVNAGLKDTIKYIVLTKGVPMKIQDTSSVSSNYFNINGNYSSVDSAVTLLYQNYSTTAQIVNPYWSLDQTQSLNHRFATNSFSDVNTGITLKYLVTRLDGYTVANVKSMIDRAVSADTSGSGYYVVDNYNGTNNFTFVSNQASTTTSKLSLLGANFYPNPFSTGSSAITTTPGSVVGYTGYGIYGGLPNDYYNNTLDFTYLNGAVTSTYESYASFSMTAPDTTNHGQIAQFIASGGSGGIGNVYEPYSTYIAKESYWMPLYAAGYTWADAAYMSLSGIDWTAIVLGDPLMRINLAENNSAPTITSVSSDRVNGTYTTGQTIDIEVIFDRKVTSTGNVTVTLETGATDRTCTFTISNSTIGMCNYVVQSGDSSADLNISSISGTIIDRSGNTLINFTPTTSLSTNKAIVINTATSVSDPIVSGTWTTRVDAGSRTWMVVDSSSDGTKLIAVSNGGYIYTSTDSGVTWNVNASPGKHVWNSAYISDDGTKLSATGYGDYIYSSTDSGATWTKNVDGGIRYWKDVTSSSDGVKLAATVNNGYIYTSTDSGATWTEQTNAGSRAWSSISSSSNGTKLAATVNNGYIYTSTDSGATWTEQTNAGSRAWYSVASSSDGTKLAATATGGYIYTSTDSGVTWTAQTNSGVRAWFGISSSSDGTKLAAGINSGYIYTSTDSGVTWTAQTDAGSRYWASVAISDDGSKVIAAASSGYVYTSSPDSTAPTIVGVSSNKTNGPYKVGAVIDIDVTFSEAVTSTGNVTVTLETGATDRTCAFTVSNSTTGTCDYTVQTGDNSSDLTVSSILGTIADQSSNAMSDFTPTTNLAENKAIIIDTSTPSISSVSSNVDSTRATITWTTDEASSSIVSYGASSSYGTTTSESDISVRATSHSITVNGLSCATNYHYQVTSKDVASNSVSSSDNTFTTSSCPGVSSGGGGGGGSARSQNVGLSNSVLSAVAPVNSLSNFIDNGMYNKKAILSTPITRILKPGKKDSQVVVLQSFLKIKADGQFGPKTLKAVKEFQSKHGLTADGIVGPKTIKLITNLVK